MEYVLNYSYKENAIKLSNVMRDQLLPGGELGAYWVEYVLRHKDEMKLLRLASVKMPFYKVYLLDFALVAAVISTLGLVLVYRAYRFFRHIKPLTKRDFLKFKVN